jgi:negative regulator of flagellin synthesis FlgM
MKVDHKVGSSLGNSIGNVDSTKAGKLSSKTGIDKAGLGKTPSHIESSQVDVSDRAQMMQKAKQIASNDTIDEAKVARLQKLIDAGDYKTDANAIADRLVDEHMNFPE